MSLGDAANPTGAVKLPLPHGPRRRKERECSTMQPARGCPQHSVFQAWGTPEAPPSHGGRGQFFGEWPLGHRFKGTLLTWLPHVSDCANITLLCNKNQGLKSLDRHPLGACGCLCSYLSASVQSLSLKGCKATGFSGTGWWVSAATLEAGDLGELRRC